MKLKILTLNLHTLQEKEIEKKNKIIANFINEREVDIIFFQEVGQISEDPIYTNNIKTSNQLLSIFPKLKRKYNYDYRYKKRGFDKYDEGLAIVSKYPIIYSDSYYLSKSKDYYNWQTRTALLVNVDINGQQVDLITTHLGWDSESEKLDSQLANFLNVINPRHISICAGDFNVPYNSSYIKKIKETGLIEASDLAGIDPTKNPTFPGILDAAPFLKTALDHQIDHIFVNKPYKVNKYEVVFKEERVSDHYGVYAEIEI
jgi:maltose 6'-phosphate phosphatase